MNNQTLILAGSGYELTVAPEAEQLKADLLTRAAAITRVSGPDENEAARAEIKALAAMRNQVEKSRKAVKEPVLQVGRDIDAKAKVFVAEIDAEEKRVSGLVGAYAAEVERERQKALREMEAKRGEEEKARRAEAEAAAAAERARIAAEQAAWEATDEAQSAQAEEAARIAEAQAKAAAEEKARLEAGKPILAPAPAAGVRFAWDFEVVDIHRLAQAHPELVRMEARRADILEVIRALPDDDRMYREFLRVGIQLIRKSIVSTR